MGFQKSINIQQAPAVEGNFASANPRASVLAGEGALIAGVGGVTVGRFAWADADGQVTNAGAGAPTGFVHRQMQAVITEWLGEASMLIPEGLAMALFSNGDFWAKSSTVATVGQSVYASNTTGEIQTGDAGETIAGFTETRFVVKSPAAVGELFKISTWG